MDDETKKHISSLQDIIKALTVGLESAVMVIEKWDEMEPEKKEFVVHNLRKIIETGEKAYAYDLTKHWQKRFSI